MALAERDRFADAAAFVARLAEAVRTVAPTFGLAPDPTAAYVTAHAALESGYGASMFGHNALGQKVGRLRIKEVDPSVPGWHGASFSARTREYDRATGKTTRIQDHFRAYDSIEDDVADHLRWLSELTRYAASWRLLQAGDATYFRQLGVDGWYTDPVDPTFAAWRSVLRRVRGLLPPGPAGAPPVAGGPAGPGPTPAPGGPRPHGAAYLAFLGFLAAAVQS